MEWANATMPHSCGLCGKRIAPGDRIALLTSKQLVRCEACASRIARVVDVVSEHLRATMDLDDGVPPPVDAADRPICLGCGRIMSDREAREQGACDECRPDWRAI